MRLSEFILLGIDEKKSAVLHQGVLIGKRLQAGDMVFLFQLENYYVETFCNAATKAIEEYRVFDTTLPLHPYLDSISLQSLFE